LNTIENFRAVLHAKGIAYAGPIHPDGKLHRFKAEGDRAKNSWYVFHPATGTAPSIAVFGCWKRGIAKRRTQARWAGIALRRRFP